VRYVSVRMGMIGISIIVRAGEDIARLGLDIEWMLWTGHLGVCAKGVRTVQRQVASAVRIAQARSIDVSMPVDGMKS
jgi:hypothetical protein